MKKELNCIQNKIEKSFVEYKDNIAIEHDNNQITYHELNIKSELFVSYLSQNRIPAKQYIGVLLSNKIDAIASILAILKCRCIFVPIDIELPAGRIVSQLNSVDCRHIFVHGENKEFQDYIQEQKINIHLHKVEDVFDSNFKINEKNEEKRYEYENDDQIYIYFTSGTEGKPKGIIGRNVGLSHFVDWEIETLKIQNGTKVSQIPSIGFDAFLRDVFVPLCAGGTICIPHNRETILNPELLKNWIEDSKINLIHCVPSVFRILNLSNISSTNFSSLKYILMAGETIVPNELNKWFEIFGQRIQLINLYGATEVTMAKTFYLVKPSDVQKQRIPVGKAMKGSAIIILNEELRKCGVMQIGHIYIQTPYMSLGYYGDDKLNSEKFISNPLSNDPQDLLYKTGDLGRFLVNGELEFLGRIDRQLKIRGNRVELGEIENYVYNYPQIQGCVVNVKVEAEESNLCLYVVSSQKVVLSELKEFVSGGLPQYMIPKCIMQIDKIPLTINGKVDYDLLPEPQIYVEDIILPRNETEKRLAKILVRNTIIGY